MTRAFMVALAVGVLFIMAAAPLVAKPKAKVTICHIPPGNPANVHTIIVGADARPAHLAHGDVLGTCPDVSTSA